MTLADDLRNRWRDGGMLIRLVLVNIAVFLSIWAVFGGLCIFTRDRAVAMELFQTRWIHMRMY